jgi:integrase
LQTVAVDGRDPSSERESFRSAPTVNELLDRYIAEHIERKNRPTTRTEFKRIIERDIRSALGQIKVAAVTRQDVSRLHIAHAATPRQANLILAVVSKAFSLAELWEMRAEGTNPCTKIEHYPENHRERFLSGDELTRLGATLRQAETVGLSWKTEGRTLYRRTTTAAVELLLFTGCRLSEVLNLQWPQVDFESATITLTETKSGRAQVVTMNAPARQVLMELRAASRSEWVLPSPTNAKCRLSKSAIEYAWQRIRAAAKIDDVRLHDLRHTVGTYAGQTGANAFLVRDDPVRTLNDQVGERISAALTGRPVAEVVPLKASKSAA